MAKNTDITEAEFRVMKCLWQRSPLEIKDIMAALPDTGWTGNTVRTLIVRLIDKGAVAAETGSKVYRYRPLLGEDEVCMKETRHFLDKVYDGSAARLFAALTGSGSLSRQEIDEIQEMISSMPREDGHV